MIGIDDHWFAMRRSKGADTDGRVVELGGAFGAFLREFNELFKKLPQRGLWGQSVGGSAKGHPQSDVSRRLDQVRSELRRFPRAGIRFAGRTILIEGERLEIV